MSRIRIALAAAALLAAATGISFPAGATTAAATSSPSFAGVTTFSATHSGRVMLRLTHRVPVRMSKYGLAIEGLDIHGGGRIVGIVITAADGRTGVVQFRMQPCYTAGCTASGRDDFVDSMGFTWGRHPTLGPGAKPLRLSPGLYQVSVFTDGAPLTVTWRLPNLPGHTHVRVELPQRATVVSATEHGVAGTPQSPAWAQSAAGYTLNSDITILGALHRVSDAAHVTSESDWCTYHDTEPPGDDIGPGCAGGDGIGFASTYVSTGSESGSDGFMLTIGKGSAGHYTQVIKEYGAQVATDVHDTYFFADAGLPNQ